MQPSPEAIDAVDNTASSLIETFSAMLAYAVSERVMQPTVGMQYISLAMDLARLRVSLRKTYPSHFERHRDDCPNNSKSALPDIAGLDINALLRDLERGD